MNTDNKVNVLEQAQTARSLGNCSLVIQCLQQLILEEDGERRSRRAGGGSGSPLGQEGRGEQGEQLLDLAIDVLVAGDFQERWDIAKVFPKLGQKAYALGVDEVIAPLLEILEDEDAEEELRWYAARILGEFNHPAVINALVELLKSSESEELTAMAAAALGNLGSPAVADLTSLLAQKETRLLAVRSLSYIRHSETIAPLLSVVQDPQITVRTAAIEALSSFHDSRIPPVLLNALDDIAAPVRREAVTGLSFRPDLREELDLVNRLLPRLYDFNLDVCAAAAIALGRLGTDAAANALYQVLKSPLTPVSLQIEIVRALGRVGTQTGLGYLRQALNQLESVTLWQEIVTVLGRVEQPLTTKAAEILIEMLSGHPATQHQNVKQAIALSLGQLGEIQALAPLIQLLAAPDAGVRLHAIAALKQLAPEVAYRQLEQLATNQALAPDLKQGIAIALSEWTRN